jgi:hypothetical protein
MHGKRRDANSAMTCTFRPWALCLPGVERPVPARGHGDPVDPQQGAVEDHERLPAREVAVGRPARARAR